MYGLIILSSLIVIEILCMNYTHFFNTMFKIKTVSNWGYLKLQASVLIALIVTDLQWYNSLLFIQVIP